MDYADKVRDAMLEAIIEASRDGETQVAMMQSGEIVDACVSIIAMVMATSPMTDTPRGVRECSEEVGKRVRQRTTAYREARAHGAMDFITVVPEQLM